MPRPPEMIPFHRPHITGPDIDGVRTVLKSGWLTTGKVAEEFEGAFAQAVGGGVSAIAVSSCTAALHLALELLSLPPGAEVIVPTMTFTATAEAVLRAGLTPVIADIDPLTLMLTPETAGPKCRAKTAALLPVHYGGNPTGFLTLLEFARAHKFRVVDDAAHAFPAHVTPPGGPPRPIGSQGLSDATAFSFYATKTITTAEGGMLTFSKNAALEARARRLTLHGIDADAFQRSRQAVYHYEVTERGYKYNLPDLLAALGRSQTAKAELLRNLRATTARAYLESLRPLAAREWLTLPTIPIDAEPAWHLFPIRLNIERFGARWDRDAIGAALKQRGIGTSMHYRPLHRHTYWSKELGLGTEKFPVADAAYAELLSLPIWPGMQAKHIQRVEAALYDVLLEAGR